MAQQVINNGESGLDVRTKLNAMFAEIYALLAAIDLSGNIDGGNAASVAVNNIDGGSASS